MAAVGFDLPLNSTCPRWAPLSHCMLALGSPRPSGVHIVGWVIAGCWASCGGRLVAFALPVGFVVVGHPFAVVGVISAFHGCSELVGGKEEMDE